MGFLFRNNFRTTLLHNVSYYDKVIYLSPDCKDIPVTREDDDYFFLSIAQTKNYEADGEVVKVIRNSADAPNKLRVIRGWRGI